MGRIEDLKETAPCGMEIHYTVDENDMIAYNDINGRGVFCDKMVEINPDPKCVLAENLMETIKKNRKKYNEMRDLLARFEAEVDEPEK